MKKILIIIGVLIVIGLLGWFLLRNTNTPLEEVLKDGLPFGSDEGVNIPPNQSAEEADGTGQAAQFDTPAPDAKLFRISNTPVAGFAVLNNKVRYVERATGHIQETNLDTNTKVKITNQTLPKIYEAHFRADGNAVLLRSLEADSDVVENLSLVLTPPRSTSVSTSSPQATELYSVSATNMRGDMDSVVAGSGNTLFYVLEDTSAIVSSTFTGTDVRTLFASAFNNWQLGRLGNNLLVYTKANSGTSGYAYSLSAGGGSLTKLLGPLNGLTLIGSPSGGHILYSYAQDNEVKLFAKNLGTNTAIEILPVTLAEKCVWSAKTAGVFFCGTPLSGLAVKSLDDWYAGKTLFSDYLWRFDSNSEIAQLSAQPKTDFGVDLDISEPKLTPDEKYLIFINKIDLTLWAIRLE